MFSLLPAVLAHVFDPDELPTVTGFFFTSELPGQVPALFLPWECHMTHWYFQLAGGPVAGAIRSSTNGQWTPVILYSGLTVFCGSLFAVATRFQGVSSFHMLLLLWNTFYRLIAVNRRVFVTT